MATYHGRTAALGLGEEVTYGTLVSITNWRPLVSTDLQRKPQKAPRSDLRGSSSSAMRRTHFQQSEEAGGRATILATYENCGMIWKHALGALATTGAGPYVHKYTLATDVPEGLSAEVIRGTSATSEDMEGGRINGLNFRVAAGEQAMIELDMIFETGSTRGSPSTPTFATESVVLHNQSGLFGFNGSTYCLVDLDLAVGNALERRQFLGSQLTKKPLRSDFQTVELTVTIEADDTVYTELLDDTEGDATITFTGLGNNIMAITLHNAYITEATDPVNDAGIVRQTVRLIGQSDGTDEGLLVQITNDLASGIAN